MPRANRRSRAKARIKMALWRETIPTAYRILKRAGWSAPSPHEWPIEFTAVWGYGLSSVSASYRERGSDVWHYAISAPTVSGPGTYVCCLSEAA